MTARDILGKALTVRELLSGVKYSIDYYQREYEWTEKQIRELIDDLTNKFLEEFDPEHERSQVANYPHYFLGTIIISKKDRASYLVDGQQRLTSLTLLLIFLRHLRLEAGLEPAVSDLILSEKYGQQSFNLDIPDRVDCMSALYDGDPFDPTERSESVRNLYERYQDIEAFLPDEVRGEVLPYFTDWLLENVHLVEITTYSDNDAYTIFETMNDRGLSLSPTSMLKGYLLANINDPDKRSRADQRWRTRVRELSEMGKDVEPDFFKTWLRSQYANKIRERKRGARPEDFDRIGTEFHRWLRENKDGLGLDSSNEFYRLVERDFDFYCRWYLRIVEASRQLTPGMEHIFHNAQHGFTLQYVLLLAPLTPDDDPDIAQRKIWLVSRFVDILIAWRLWNFRSIAYSTMQYAMFLVMRSIRGLDITELGARLHRELSRESETFASNHWLRVHQQNRYALHRLLARMTDYIETRSGMPSRYAEYANTGNVRHEVEHIWADHYDRHQHEFDHSQEFADYRNRIGGLLLLPKSFNASYGDLPYEDKLPHYNSSQNLLARSLHPMCYEHNPGFLQFVKESGLPFRAHPEFAKEDLDERTELYRQIAEQVWNPTDLLS